MDWIGKLEYALYASYAVWQLAAIAIGIPFLIRDEIREHHYRRERGDDT
jgi:hypothetical protein